MSITTSPRRWLSGLVLLSAAVLLASPAGADEWLEETHVFNLGVDAPAFDSTFEYNLDLPQFDTAGGARELVAYRVDHYLYSNYTYSVDPNPTELWHGADLSWRQTWSSTLDSEPWYPMNQSSGYVDARAGVGAICAPGFAGAEPFETQSGIAGYESHADADMLARLSGTGTATMACTHTLSALTIAEPARWPGNVPPNQRVFDPDMIDLTLDRIGMDVTVTYYWTPEPTSLALLGLGAVALLRRR